MSFFNLKVTDCWSKVHIWGECKCSWTSTDKMSAILPAWHTTTFMTHLFEITIWELLFKNLHLNLSPGCRWWVSGPVRVYPVVLQLQERLLQGLKPGNSHPLPTSCSSVAEKEIKRIILAQDAYRKPLKSKHV